MTPCSQALPIVLLLCISSFCKFSGATDLTPSSTNLTGISDRIYNGLQTNGPVVKHTARISMAFTDGSSKACTGTLVKQNLILTAAHCFFEGGIFSRKSVSRADTYILLGNEITVAQKRTVKKFYYHKSYSTLLQTSDVALIELDHDAPSTYRTARISDPPNVSEKSRVSLAGYGKTENGGLATRLLRIPVYYYAKQSVCTTYAERVPWLKNQVLCHTPVLWPFGESRTHCDGDSGGPFYKMKREVGNPDQVMHLHATVSYRWGACGDPKTLMWAIKIANFKSAIDEAIGGNFGSSWHTLKKRWGGEL